MEVVLAVGEERAILQCAPPSQRNELTVKHGWLMSVQSVKREVHTAGLSMNEDSLQQGHGLFFSLFFFFNKSELSEAATIMQACTPVHTTSHLQHRTGQASCDLWVALLFLGGYLFVLFFE